uniref:Uncharacterized protein n=1 Tax=Sphaerodactylus townsendi TaxID=933632 RepID=A0ACB8EK66_9SAUR
MDRGLGSGPAAGLGRRRKGCRAPPPCRDRSRAAQAAEESQFQGKDREEEEAAILRLEALCKQPARSQGGSIAAGGFRRRAGLSVPPSAYASLTH